MPCGGSKESPLTSSIVQIIFSFWSSEIIEGILRNQKNIIGLDSFSNQLFIYLVPFLIIIVFVSTIFKSCKITVNLFGSVLSNLYGHRNRGMADPLLINTSMLLKDPSFIFIYLLRQSSFKVQGFNHNIFFEFDVSSILPIV